MAHKCNGCTKGWQSTRKCHCSLCGENFSTPGNFDRHQVRGTEIICDPIEAGLVLNKRGIWTQPGEVDYDERFKRA